jgi:hypothetical protein
MRLAYTIHKPGARRALKAALALSLLVVTALGAFAAKLMFEDHQVTADLTLKLCRKNADGGCDLIDQAQGTVNFTATTTGVGSGDINTSHNWKFRSQKGRQVSVSLQRAGRFRLDAANGWLKLDLPFTVEVDGKRINQSIHLTNESISTPFGQEGGQKAEIDGRSIIAILIGFTTVKERDIAGPHVTGVVGGTGGLNKDLILTLEVRGKAAW